MMCDTSAQLVKYFAPTEYSISNLQKNIIFCQHYSTGFPRWLLPLANNGNTMGIRP